MRAGEHAPWLLAWHAAVSSRVHTMHRGVASPQTASPSSPVCPCCCHFTPQALNPLAAKQRVKKWNIIDGVSGVLKVGSAGC